MAIKPILFNTEMVRAILDGRKESCKATAYGALWSTVHKATISIGRYSVCPGNMEKSTEWLLLL